MKTVLYLHPPQECKPRYNQLKIITVSYKYPPIA